jgi:hypothetical protein
MEDVLMWQGDRGLITDMTPDQKDRYDTEERKKIKSAVKYRYENK